MQLTVLIDDISTKITILKMNIEKLEEEDSKCGSRQRNLKLSMKKLNLNPARYHGGDFEGKAIQEMLNCACDKKFVLLDCISDKKLFMTS